MSTTETVQRRRNSLLAGIVLLRKLGPDITLSEMLAFLYVAENPGVRIKELAALMETTEATASRASRSLLAEGEPGARAPGRGWLVMAANGREAVSRHLYLSEAGIDLVQRLDALIESARPIGVRAPPVELRLRR
jgi:DNA-binding MarR family transcriptional regulator